MYGSSTLACVCLVVQVAACVFVYKIVCSHE